MIVMRKSDWIVPADDAASIEETDRQLGCLCNRQSAGYASGCNAVYQMLRVSE
jgi:hypothetical protein